MTQKVDDDSAKLALMELAEEFGAEESAMVELLPLARDGRLFLRGNLAVYKLLKAVELREGAKLEEVAMRQPQGKDYVSYSRGMTVTVKDGATEVNAVMMTTRTISAVSVLSGESPAIIEKMSVRDIRTLQEVCDALGFFE